MRLEALECEPQAFGSSATDHWATTVADAAVRLADPQSCIMRAYPTYGPDRTLLCGMAGLARESRPKTRHTAQMWGVYLAHTRRGQGHGRAMLAALIAHARTLAGLERITLTVTATQPAALALYRRLGFEEWGYEPKALKLGDAYLDEHHLALEL